MKAHNFELRHRQNFWHDIRDKIASHELDIAHVNEDRLRIEDEMRLRKMEDDEAIRRIQIDNDGLRGTICAKDAEIADLKARIAALRHEDEDISAGIKDVTNDIHAVTSHNADLRDDIHRLEGQLSHERSRGRALRADLDKARSTHAALEHNIRILEDDLNRNKAHENELAKLLGAKQSELDSKTIRLHALEDDIAGLRLRIDDRDRELADLNRYANLKSYFVNNNTLSSFVNIVFTRLICVNS